MKKITLLFVILLISAPMFWGQLPNWSSPIDTTPRQFFGVVVTQHGYALTIGDQSNGWSQKISFLDTSGNLVWEKNLGRPEHTFVFNNEVKCDSGVIVMLRDTIVSIDYSGNTLSQKKIPAPNSCSQFLAIFSNDINYVIADMGSDQATASIFIYNTDLQCTNNFMISGPIENIAIAEDGFYSLSVAYNGNVSNSARNLTKYDFSGNIIWERSFPDRTNGKICYSQESLYFGSTQLLGEQPYACFTTQKISESGQTVWTQSWYGDYARGTTPLANSVQDIIEIPGGGCIISGASTKPNQTNININLVTPVSIAYNTNGEMMWNFREMITPGSFRFTEWDEQHYLIVAGNEFDAEVGKSICKVWKFFIDGVTPVEVESNETPVNFSLSQNYPNPFNPSTTINFTLPQSGNVTLKVYDVLGKEVATLINKNLNAGTYEQTFDAGNLNLSSGIYFYRVEAGNFIQTKKMMLIK